MGTKIASRAPSVSENEAMADSEPVPPLHRQDNSVSSIMRQETKTWTAEGRTGQFSPARNQRQAPLEVQGEQGTETWGPTAPGVRHSSTRRTSCRVHQIKHCGLKDESRCCRSPLRLCACHHGSAYPTWRSGTSGSWQFVSARVQVSTCTKCYRGPKALCSAQAPCLPA
jgi:hypothetical protein